jgi:hypothetical protein
MTLKEKLESMLAETERATPGPWLSREDFDYYRGGTYLGMGPQKYVPRSDGKGNELTDCDYENAQYFKIDVCRIESNKQDERFIASARTQLPAALRALIHLLEANEVSKDALASIEKEFK